MRTVLLSFDIEEFDMPLEYGREISLDEQILISSRGTEIILDILKQHEIKATFFSTVVFARHVEHLINRIVAEGHELASHSYCHSAFQNEHYVESKNALEKISGKPVRGFRMPRMMPPELDRLVRAGYGYDASLNPVYLPGRYNNFFKPRTLFVAESLVQIPASAVPVVRFPLFWLSFHNLPLWLYKTACRFSMRIDGYLNIYFHPWEFVSVGDAKFGLPAIVSKNCGVRMIERFNEWCVWMKGRGYAFSRLDKFLFGPHLAAEPMDPTIPRRSGM